MVPADGLRYDFAQECIQELNRLTGAKFLGTKLELDLAVTCLARVGNDLPGVKKMLARQKALWARESKTAAWLNPRTLFEPEKFDGYYAQRDLPVTATDTATRRRELEELIAKSPANKASVFHRAETTPAEQEALKNFRRELAELNQKPAAA